jgi:iron complex outermembrane receptor protein
MYTVHLLCKTTIALAISSLTGFGLAPTAFAQGAPDAATDLEEIIVTGTLIRGVTPTGSPVIGFGSKDIQEQGFFNATDVLRSIPQILNLGATDSQTITAGSNTASNQTGANGVNLRGLGTASTLTLINGHRSAPGGTNAQVFDASTVPSLAIDRLEVVMDGASSLYGSDAVAGVVNMRLKKGVDGASTQLSIGSTNDVRQWSASQLFGKTWGTGSITATLEHTFRSDVFANKRSRFYDSNPYDYGLNAPNNYGGFLNSPANIQVTTSGAWGTCSTAAPCFFPVPANQNGASLTGASLPTTAASFANRYAGANIRNVYDNTSLLPEQKRDTLVLIGDQQLSKRVRLSAEILASRREFKRYSPC